MDSEKFEEFVHLTEAIPQMDNLIDRFGTQQMFTDQEIRACQLGRAVMTIYRNGLVAELGLPVSSQMPVPAPAPVEEAAVEAGDEGGKPYS